jgi:hypothetical protein
MNNQCCGFRMFIPVPGSEFFPIPDPDPKIFRIPDSHHTEIDLTRSSLHPLIKHPETTYPSRGARNQAPDNDMVKKRLGKDLARQMLI